MLSAEIRRPKKSQPMKCYNTRISTAPWIPMGKKNSKADHPDCFVRIGSPSGFISQYSHNACLVPTYLSLSLSFFSVMRGEEPILTGVKKSWSFLIFLPVPWALGSLLEIGGESQQAGDHPTHPHHSSILEPACNNILINICSKMVRLENIFFRFQLLKGNESRDIIQIFRQKWTLMVQ